MQLYNKTNTAYNNSNTTSYTKNRNNINKDNIIISHNEERRIFQGDYVSKERKVKFYISKAQECSVIINDTVVMINYQIILTL